MGRFGPLKFMFFMLAIEKYYAPTPILVCCDVDSLTFPDENIRKIYGEYSNFELDELELMLIVCVDM